MSRKPFKNKQKQKGMSLFETIPIIIAISSLIGFLLGFWGLAHKNTLHSIAARNYLTEVFHHRSNLTYFRESAGSLKHHYLESGMRVSAVGSSGGGSKFHALATTYQPLEAKTKKESPSVHRQKIWGEGIYQDGKEERNDAVAVQKPWVLVTYGICLNATCGGGD